MTRGWGMELPRLCWTPYSMDQHRTDFEEYERQFIWRVRPVVIELKATISTIIIPKIPFNFQEL